MKIMIYGYSGSGKSTIAKIISEEYSLPILYVDKILYNENWVRKDKEESKKLSEEDAFRILQTERKVLLLDVRSEAEFESSHIKGAVSMPLIRILKNPYGVSERRDKKILLYCEMGIQSGMAAECLMEAGFEQVYSFAWDANASEILEYLNL